jgi:hypothetical protein
MRGGRTITLVIYGWTIQPTILGSKVDHCATCGVTGEHFLICKTWWAEIFWIPFLLVRFQHGMACGACGAWTGIGFRTMRQGLKSGELALAGRARPNTLDLRDRIWDETGRRPSEKELYDRVTINPRRGPWDLWLKVWPILVLAIVAVTVVAAMLPPGPAEPEAKRPAAHTCWLDDEGFINGCRNADGSTDGTPVGVETTCYDVEPLPTGDFSIYCPEATPAASGG